MYQKILSLQNMCVRLKTRVCSPPVLVSRSPLSSRWGEEKEKDEDEDEEEVEKGNSLPDRPLLSPANRSLAW